MNKPLAIFAAHIGVRSETFIRRHMEDLLPEKTVVVTNNISKPHAGHWRVNCPTLICKWFKVDGNLKDKVKQFSEGVAIAQFLKKHKVQVILGEYLTDSFNFFYVTRKLGIPYFAHAHGNDVSSALRDPRWQKLYSYYKDAAGIITMNQVSRNRLIDLGIEPSKIYIIPYGVDVPDEPVKRSENTTVRCIAVGRMVAKKAPILLLKAFHKAVELYPNLRLDYIGTGDLLPEVQEFIQEFGLIDKVTLHGAQPNEFVREMMKDADIFLQHSIISPENGDEEGLPVAILEAMSFALPVVSTLHAGIPEAVLDGETGFLVKENDYLNMGQKILLLTQNSDLRLKMGFAGWQRSREFFTWEKERNSLLQVMQLEF
ncbi:Glycosyltransferase subfamily 4-like N-terminal domain-containing protein [Nostoc sp. DSM 114161]|jgi:colanic acid/amylovoran biosynthesis glycosyltransferase|uniref:glycosyltransferase family 4 protein n=1 Tax=Nostoc sp. DSM 114161 TaxID=3440143 RepID=UPI0040451CEB